MTFLLLFLYRNLKGYRFLAILAVLVSFMDVAVTILTALPLKYIPAKLQDPKKNPEAVWDGPLRFFDRFDTSHAGHIPAGQQHTVLGVILFSACLLVIASILDALLGYAQLYLAAFIGQNLTAQLRKKLFEQIQRLSLDWHGKQRKGDIVQRVTGNTTEVEKFVSEGLVNFIACVLTILGVAAVMFHYSVPYSLLSLVTFPALGVIIFSYTAAIKAAAKKAAKAAGVVADVAVEDVGAITVIKAFDLVERETDRFNRYVDKTRSAGMRAGSLQAQFTPLVTILVGGGTAVVVAVGAYVAAGNDFNFIIAMRANSIDIGTVVLFITLIGKFFQPMKELSKLANVATAASAGAERIQDILNQAPEVVEMNVVYNGPRMLRGDISFENVFFGYTPEKHILKGINLHIPAGKKVALVGLSGGGKTTLVKLIPRFYEASNGVVRIDGRDNREYPLSMLRQNVGMVLQESVLFEGTILENLKIGRPHATIEEVINATKQAHIHDVIMSWPEGYGTRVLNQGKNFSGGQRQRLAIARALLSDAHILVLDEPTAALDVEAEMEVMTALEQLVVGRTVLMISHRLNALGKVDEIIVLKDGLIVEQGSYKDLKSRPNGVFAELLKRQRRYDVDYAGNSMIIPRSELAGPLNIRQRPVPQAQNVPAQSPLVPVIAPGNGLINGKRRARIAVTIDGKVVQEYALDKPVLHIGRYSANDIIIRSQRISRHHARVVWENDGWVIEDAQSLNGISYQGALIEHHKLTSGDRIYFAPSVILTYLEESASMQALSVSPTPPLAVRKYHVIVSIDGRFVMACPLRKDTMTVGRKYGNDIQISSLLVSGEHAKLVKQDSNWLIIDRKSRNGLTYQGQRVERHIMRNGDCVYLAPGVMLQLEQKH
jgi:ABC-type multidrug transport system fused ATPase/permease subunit/pSer/pThr/pTyr-binding forkhead associated (FHA) protein